MRLTIKFLNEEITQKGVAIDSQTNENNTSNM